MSGVLCLGAAHWDMIARTGHALPPGADVPGRIRRVPGGVAANVALGLVAAGCAAELMAAIGADAEGEALLAALKADGVACGEVLREGRTGCYLAIERADGALHAAVADCDGLEAAAAALGRALAARMHARALPCGLVLDGNLPVSVLKDALGAPAPAIALLVASPEKAASLRGLGLHQDVTLYANLAEARAICATPLPDTIAAAQALRARGAGAALVTDGPRAACFADSTGPVSARPPAAAIRRITGAGDALAAAHIAARLAGLSPQAALEAALTAAARHLEQIDP